MNTSKQKQITNQTINQILNHSENSSTHAKSSVQTQTKTNIINTLLTNQNNNIDEEVNKTTSSNVINISTITNINKNIFNLDKNLVFDTQLSVKNQTKPYEFSKNHQNINGNIHHSQLNFFSNQKNKNGFANSSSKTGFSTKKLYNTIAIKQNSRLSNEGIKSKNSNDIVFNQSLIDDDSMNERFISINNQINNREYEIKELLQTYQKLKNKVKERSKVLNSRKEYLNKLTFLNSHMIDNVFGIIRSKSLGFK